MKVLGLDLSSKPGYALMDEGLLVAKGTEFKLKDEWSQTQHHLPDYTLQDIATGVALFVRKLLLEHQPDLVFIEQSNQGSGMSAMKGQEFIHYAVLSTIRDNGYGQRTHYVYSSSWKSACQIKMTKEQRVHNKLVKAKAAKGKITSKHLAVQWANQKFNLNLIMKDEDTADAIGVAYGGYEIWKRKNAPSNKNSTIDEAFT